MRWYERERLAIEQRYQNGETTRREYLSEIADLEDFLNERMDEFREDMAGEVWNPPVPYQDY